MANFQKVGFQPYFKKNIVGGRSAPSQVFTKFRQPRSTRVKIFLIALSSAVSSAMFLGKGKSPCLVYTVSPERGFGFNKVPAYHTTSEWARNPS